MINVLHVVLGLEVGGLEKFVLGLLDNYTGNINPYVVCLERKGALGAALDPARVFEVGKGPGFSLSAVRTLKRLVTELGIDIVHTHNPAPHLHGALAAYLGGARVVHTKHGRNYPRDYKKIWCNRVASFFSDAIVAVSDNARDVCLHVERIAPAKVSVILNGVDSGLFAPGARRDPALVPKIGIVARLSPEKDHATLLAACAILARRQFPFTLEVIGDGPLRGALEVQSATLGLDSRVNFRGMQDDVAGLLRDLDLFVLSSVTEGISLTLLEAMATELPVVATEVGGNPEVVLDGGTGFLVPAGNPEFMAERLAQLIGDPALRKEMGERGRKRVLEHFDVRATCYRYERLYSGLLTREVAT
ncbi:glycosyl transferase [Geomonas silvestris]|uniref:Glycosyl transferase n=1 Tax=Geomonas silvestris TaxID=2740184 RepID=A0A6V8MCT1_9BACT|nr:glycosyltransferase [Geomonas silvestris]GFO57772.1 glycosyl transferase [Geomonas silvestris]